MAILLATAVRNARLDVIESNIGTTVRIKVFTGSPPSATTDANSGTDLVTITVPSDWLAAASGGAKGITGSWTGTASAGSGATPGYFRLYNSSGTFDGTTCMIQGSAAIGSGDMNFNGTITSGQTVTVSAFTLTDGNGNP
jgi:hypothetical protein